MKVNEIELSQKKWVVVIPETELEGGQSSITYGLAVPGGYLLKIIAVDMGLDKVSQSVVFIPEKS